MEDKERVGRHAATLVENGMKVGIGSGSTAQFFIKALAERVKEETLDLQLVATSEESKHLAESLGLTIHTLNEIGTLDLTIDGVDEFTDDLDGIKGGGGCLLEEKIVASNSLRVVWMAEERKHVKTLGAFPLPIEVIKNGSELLKAQLEEKGYHPEWRLINSEERFHTDNDNYILDLHLEEITDPVALHDELIHMVGVVETGLFLGMTENVLLADNGEVYWTTERPLKD
ncbi:MAG: ribose-5-phosphate isomerase RpiA [Aerococcus sp.]|nr:ribose-5-phosphate isomerase RpiA [Aerococcus sp.]